MAIKIKVKDKLEDETLDLSGCELKDVPVKEISTIKKASHLDLSYNLLVSIPQTIVTLSHIVTLDLSKNMLTEIPKNIGEMKQLKHLDLYSNQISRLPLSMGDLKNLKWLDLKDNPLTAAVAVVAGPCNNTIQCQQCARSIVSYLKYIRLEVDEEKKRRNDALTAATAPVATSKNESKKKKKTNNSKDEKQNQKKADMKLPASHQIVTPHRTQSNGQSKSKSNESSSRGVYKSLCGIVFPIVKFIIFSGLLAVFAIILLPRFNQPLSDQFTTYLQVQTKLPVKEYQEIGIKTFDASSEILVRLLNRTKTLASEIFAKMIEGSNCCSK
ncbi:leucine-rich repeat-containing protein 59 [Fopius arisanus]|uniref:Leucine-rich repeat-containing protein 59 n=1 Tax=Fopius arisanus TaxID=64838 RepID=A0A9R1SYE0_9HYME|nr:PREDICTED: leucine-rich repeat-containing protein 59 [Fopius arisanus]